MNKLKKEGRRQDALPNPCKKITISQPRWGGEREGRRLISNSSSSSPGVYCSRRCRSLTFYPGALLTLWKRDKWLSEPEIHLSYRQQSQRKERIKQDQLKNNKYRLRSLTFHTACLVLLFKSESKSRLNMRVKEPENEVQCRVTLPVKENDSFDSLDWRSGSTVSQGQVWGSVFFVYLQLQ